MKKKFRIRGSFEGVDDITGIRVSFREKATGKELDAARVRSNGSFKLNFRSNGKRIDGVILLADTNESSGNFTIGDTAYDFDDKVRRKFKARASKINEFEFTPKRNEQTSVSRGPGEQASVSRGPGEQTSVSRGPTQNQCCAYSGRFITFEAAARGREEALSQGYSVSPVLGEGGILSSWSQREYFFRYCGIC